MFHNPFFFKFIFIYKVTCETFFCQEFVYGPNSIFSYCSLSSISSLFITYFVSTLHFVNANQTLTKDYVINEECIRPYTYIDSFLNAIIINDQHQIMMFFFISMIGPLTPHTTNKSHEKNAVRMPQILLYTITRLFFLQGRDFDSLFSIP